jgi:YfiH family protein
MLQAHRESNVTFLTSPLLDQIPGIVHAFSTRRADSGDFTLGGDDPLIQDNRDRFMAAVGLEAWPVARLKQVHSNVVSWVGDNEFVNEVAEGDASGTSLPGIALGVMTADCVPILIADSTARAVAVVHAGWRGTSEGVAPKTVDRMTSGSRVAAGDLSAVIGPHIGVCCLEVGEEVFDWFAQPEIFERRSEWPRPHLNLAKANRLQLVAAGLAPEKVQVSTLCTRCRGDLFHSYRRDNDRSGRMMSVIGIQP